MDEVGDGFKVVTALAELVTVTEGVLVVVFSEDSSVELLLLLLVLLLPLLVELATVLFDEEEELAVESLGTFDEIVEPTVQVEIRSSIVFWKIVSV